MSCPPIPMCPTVFQACQAPMVLITPRDETDCRIGCDYCGIADVPEPPSFNSCGVSIERCVRDDPDCVRVYPCNNTDELVLAHFPYIPCKENCVNVTLTIEDPTDGKCDKFESAQIIRTEEGKFILTDDINYGCDDIENFERVQSPEMIDPRYLPCATEWYMQGDLVCYCPCEDMVVPPIRPPRDDTKPPNPPPRLLGTPNSPSPPPPRSAVSPGKLTSEIRAPSPPPKGSVVEYKMPTPPPSPRRALSPAVSTAAGDASNPLADAMTNEGTQAPLPTSESSCLLAGHAWDHDNGECVQMESAGAASEKKDCPDGCYWNYRLGKCSLHVIRGNTADCSAGTASVHRSTNHTGSVDGLTPSLIGVASIVTLLAGVGIYRYKFHKPTPTQSLLDSPSQPVTFCENPIHV